MDLKDTGTDYRPGFTEVGNGVLCYQSSVPSELLEPFVKAILQDERVQGARFLSTAVWGRLYDPRGHGYRCFIALGEDSLPDEVMPDRLKPLETFLLCGVQVHFYTPFDEDLVERFVATVAQVVQTTSQEGTRQPSEL